MFDFLKKKGSKTSDKSASSSESRGVRAELRELGYEAQLARLAPDKPVAPHITKGYKHSKTDPRTTEAAFVNQKSKPRLGLDKAHQAQIDFSEKEVKHPKMRFSDDRSMAVQSEKRAVPGTFGKKEAAHAKEVYLTQAVAAASNEQLANAGSKVQLTPIGHSITYDDKTLVGMRPTARAPFDEVERVARGLQTSICRDVAEMVSGGSRRHHGQFVVRREEARRVTRLPADYSGSDKSESAQSLAGSVAGASDPSRIGQAWGEGTKKGGAHVAEAEASGLNRAAAPEVGQSYGIFTVADVDSKDYVNHGGEVNPNAWGYHFAGVVAKSEDGADRVTLENFNRKDDITHASLAAFRTLEKKYKTQALAAARYVEEIYAGAEASLLPALLAKLRNSRDVDGQISAITKQLNDSGNKAWYFAMYGSHPGQTFHDVHGPTAANPLTAAVDMHEREG